MQLDVKHENERGLSAAQKKRVWPKMTKPKILATLFEKLIFGWRAIMRKHNFNSKTHFGILCWAILGVTSRVQLIGRISAPREA
jgi:hypothetical protein